MAFFTVADVIILIHLFFRARGAEDFFASSRMCMGATLSGLVELHIAFGFLCAVGGFRGRCVRWISSITVLTCTLMFGFMFFFVYAPRPHTPM